MNTLQLTWVNECPGVDFANAINMGGAGTPPNNTKNVNLLRIDLTHPKIGFIVSPFEFLKKEGNRTTDFLRHCFDTGKMQAMYATNANFFEFQVENERDRFFGLAVSEGTVLSYPSPLTAPCTLYINRQNAAIIGGCGAQLDAFSLQQGHVQPWTAVSGSCMLVTNGVSTAPSPSSPLSRGAIAARTAIGLSAPTADGTPQYLYLITIDGIDQPQLPKPPQTYYYGATLQDVADWLLAAGAYTAVGLDGGGSTTMAKAVTAAAEEGGFAVERMNSPHDTEDQSVVCERKVAVSFGVVVLS